MQLQNAGNASGVALAISVSARPFLVAGTSCCLVYNYDARKQPTQWLREIPPAFSDADWWVVHLIPRVFITLIQSRNLALVLRARSGLDLGFGLATFLG